MITVNTKEFKRALTNCKTCWNGKSSLPVLQNVLIASVEHGNLRLCTTNLERGIVQHLPGYTEGDGINTTVPLKELYDYVSKVKGSSITLELDDKYLVLDGVIKLRVTKAEEFPPIPGIADAVPNGTLIPDDLNAVIHAASTDDMRPVLQGVYVTTACMTCTDGFRMAVRSGITDTAKDIIIPVDTIKAALKIDKKCTGIPMRLNAERGQVILTVSNGYIVSPLIKGNFPDVSAIVPRETSILAMFDRKELIEAATMVGSFYGSKDSQLLLMDVRSGSCTLRNRSDGERPEAERTIECDCNSGIDTALNWKYLVDVLKVLKEDAVLMQFNADNTPIMITEGSHVEVIMPMHKG